jgi:hypothetical protein
VMVTRSVLAVVISSRKATTGATTCGVPGVVRTFAGAVPFYGAQSWHMATTTTGMYTREYDAALLRCRNARMEPLLLSCRLAGDRVRTFRAVVVETVYYAVRAVLVVRGLSAVVVLEVFPVAVRW